MVKLDKGKLKIDLLEKIEIFHNKGESIIINGIHYHDGGKVDRSKVGGFLGHSGRSFMIKMNDGKLIETNNLWCQGEIPEIFKNILKDNAEFV